MVIVLIIGVILIGVAVYLYYQQNINRNKKEQTTSNTTTEQYATTEIQEVITNEVASVIENESSAEEFKQETSTTEQKQNKKLPDNYEWDEKRWGEPPQIVYDFAENQEKFDFIVSEVDSLLSEGEGFTTRRNNDKLYSKSKNADQLKKDIDYLLNNTNFYGLIRYVSGDWDMEYNQGGNNDKYMYSIIYDDKITEEEAWDEGCIKVVGNWYFFASPKI